MNRADDSYSVDLEVFQGPLDLLLYLIRKNEIEIYDIPIAAITDQYLSYVEMMKLLNLEVAGEYLVMAATLIRIKAQLLLPRVGGEEEEEDPLEELTLALLEYRKYKEAGEILREKRDDEEHYTEVPSRGNGHREKRIVLSDETSLLDLLTAFKEVMDNLKEDDSYYVSHPELSVERRVERIVTLLTQEEFATFEEIFSDVKIKLAAIVTFLAILEMVKTRRIVVRQAIQFSEIRVYPTEWLGESPVEEVRVAERISLTPREPHAVIRREDLKIEEVTDHD
jgi:segregation and condensation protein A